MPPPKPRAVLRRKVAFWPRSCGEVVSGSPWKQSETSLGSSAHPVCKSHNHNLLTLVLPWFAFPHMRLCEPRVASARHDCQLDRPVVALQIQRATRSGASKSQAPSPCQPATIQSNRVGDVYVNRFFPADPRDPTATRFAPTPRRPGLPGTAASCIDPPTAN